METEKKKNPLISVILPTYNRARCLSRSINSVLNQTFSNLELIIVDDGSTDNTRELVKAFLIQGYAIFIRKMPVPVLPETMESMKR